MADDGRTPPDGDQELGRAATDDQEQPLAGVETEAIAQALRAIRRLRRMRASDVAEAMGMPTRSYEHLETGSGRITYARIVAFAEATDSDPNAIQASTSFGCPEFAIRCVDNKLMSIMMIAMMELNEDLGDDIAYLDARTLVGAFTRLARDLAAHVRKRDTFAEEWLRDGASRLQPGSSSERTRPGRRPR